MRLVISMSRTERAGSDVKEWAAIYREPRIPISETFQLHAVGVTVNFLFIKQHVTGIPLLSIHRAGFPFHKFNAHGIVALFPRYTPNAI